MNEPGGDPVTFNAAGEAQFSKDSGGDLDYNYHCHSHYQRTRRNGPYLSAAGRLLLVTSDRWKDSEGLLPVLQALAWPEIQKYDNRSVGLTVLQRRSKRSDDAVFLRPVEIFVMNDQMQSGLRVIELPEQPG